MKITLKTAGVLAALAALALTAYALRERLQPADPMAGLVGGNGRIEATEIAVATKLAGRVEAILVNEGDRVQAGQTLARLQVQSLQAQREEAQARLEQARQAVATAQAQVALREADRQSVLAQVAQRESELDAAQRRLARSDTLAREGAASTQELDDDRARARGAQAALAATLAQVAAADAALVAARTQVDGAQSSTKAAAATLARMDVELADSELKAPRDGRVQLRVAEAGEVVGAGGRVLSLVDLSDVYMGFFLPETVVGRLPLGAEVRIVLDAAPDFVVPARLSFVASTAQFTPKTVETASERQKLMFRVKAQVDPELLARHPDQVKTGLPGVAWIRLDPATPWPPALRLRSER